MPDNKQKKNVDDSDTGIPANQKNQQGLSNRVDDTDEAKAMENEGNAGKGQNEPNRQNRESNRGAGKDHVN